MERSRRAVACAPPPTARGRTPSAVDRYLRAVEPVTRGPIVVGLFVAVFAAAGGVDGRVGLLLASAWLLFMGTYCLANFWHCREAHCGVTGPGWTLIALLGFAAALTPAGGPGWYPVDVEITAALVVLALGYGLEGAVATATGQRALR